MRTARLIGLWGDRVERGMEKDSLWFKELQEKVKDEQLLKDIKRLTAIAWCFAWFVSEADLLREDHDQGEQVANDLLWRQYLWFMAQEKVPADFEDKLLQAEADEREAAEEGGCDHGQ